MSAMTNDATNGPDNGLPRASDERRRLYVYVHGKKILDLDSWVTEVRSEALDAEVGGRMRCGPGAGGLRREQYVCCHCRVRARDVVLTIVDETVNVDIESHVDTGRRAGILWRTALPSSPSLYRSNLDARASKRSRQRVTTKSRTTLSAV